MDRPTLSPSIRREIGALFLAELGRSGPEVLASDFEGIAQRRHDLGRRVMGAVVEGVGGIRAAEALVEPPSCPLCSRPMRLIDGARPPPCAGAGGR